jgi:hypothetical protein
MMRMSKLVIVWQLLSESESWRYWFVVVEQR